MLGSALKRSVQLGTCVLICGASGCCKPDSIEVRTWRENGECKMEIDFEESAFGVYITSPGATIPRKQEKFEWLTYWGIDTTTFPPAINPPVLYGIDELDGGEDSKIASIKSNASGKEDDPFWKRVGLPENTSAEYPLPVTTDDGRVSLETVGAFVVHVVTLGGNGELTVGEVDDAGKAIPGRGFRCGETYGSLPLHYGWE